MFDVEDMIPNSLTTAIGKLFATTSCDISTMLLEF
jgi:hypothetical protein